VLVVAAASEQLELSLRADRAASLPAALRKRRSSRRWPARPPWAEGRADLLVLLRETSGLPGGSRPRCADSRLPRTYRAEQTGGGAGRARERARNSAYACTPSLRPPAPPPPPGKAIASLPESKTLFGRIRRGLWPGLGTRSLRRPRGGRRRRRTGGGEKPRVARLQLALIRAAERARRQTGRRAHLRAAESRDAARAQGHLFRGARRGRMRAGARGSSWGGPRWRAGWRPARLEQLACASVGNRWPARARRCSGNARQTGRARRAAGRRARHYGPALSSRRTRQDESGRRSRRRAAGGPLRSGARGAAAASGPTEADPLRSRRWSARAGHARRLRRAQNLAMAACFDRARARRRRGGTRSTTC